MSELFQLTYISQATFEDDIQNNVRPEVSRILLQSRKNNPIVGVVGALYYKNGYFFQVLEGPKFEVEGLYKKIEKDPRHKNSKILTSRPIKHSGFNNWSMKYGLKDDDVNDLLNKNGLAFFNPYRFDENITNEMIHLLQDVPLLMEDAIPSKKDSSIITNPVKLNIALFLSILAFLISLFGLIKNG